MVRHLSIVTCGLFLAACSSSGDLMRTATPTVPLQFESEPPGAEIKTSGGQTCRTPCALAVPAADFEVTYNLTGYEPQTIPVKLLPPEDMRDTAAVGAPPASPRFDQSPVTAELVKTNRRRAPAKKPRVAKKPPPEQPQQQQQQQTQQKQKPVQQQQTQQQQTQQQQPAGGFAPPPSTSGFNPPPQNSGGGFGQPVAPPPASAWPSPPQTR